MAYRQVVRARGLGQAPSATAGASSVLTQSSGVDWSTVPWYAVPFVGVDVGVMKAYCLANPSDPACTPGPTLAPGSASPGLPVNYSSATPAGAIPGNVTGETVDNPYTVVLPDASALPVTSGFDWTSIPAWVWAAGAVVAGVVVLKVLGGGR
jgi:hypothetical protein